MVISIRIAAAALLMAAAFQPVAASAQAEKSGLTRQLEAELSRFPSKSGIYVKNLATGEEAGVRAMDHYDSASTIKVAVMVLAYRLSDQKKLDLNSRYKIEAKDYRGGSGIFRFNDFGLTPTLRDVITQMIITSDNSATDIMIAKVGGIPAVNAFLQSEGYKVLKLNGTTLDLFRSFYSVYDPSFKTLGPEDLFALMSNNTAFTNSRQKLIEQFHAAANGKNYSQLLKEKTDGEDFWLGVMAPAEIGRLLEGIERDTIASKESCEEMKRILREQQSGTRKIPHYLSVPVGHKTGETGTVTNDIGIIYAHSGPIVIASFNMDVEGLAADADDRIGHVARLVVEYFDGVSTGGRRGNR